MKREGRGKGGAATRDDGPTPAAAGHPNVGAAATRGPAPDALDRGVLRNMITLNGGLRRTAARAGLGPGNLSRFLGGGGGVSGAALERLLEALGLPGGAIDRTVVHRWHPQRPMTAAALDDALLGYFAEGVAEIAAIKPGESLLDRAARHRIAWPNSYAISDGRLHAILRLPHGGRPPVEEMRSLRWLGRHERAAVVRVADPAAWFDGDAGPTVTAFGAAWPALVLEPTDDELLSVIRRLGLSNAAVLDLIRRRPRPPH